MIHAKLVEESGPDRARSDETLEQCTRRLSSRERDYFRRRADQEVEAARLASCCEARLAHEELAEAYRLLCRSHNCQDDPHIASALSTFPERAFPSPLSGDSLPD